MTPRERVEEIQRDQDEGYICTRENVRWMLPIVKAAVRWEEARASGRSSGYLREADRLAEAINETPLTG